MNSLVGVLLRFRNNQTEMFFGSWGRFAFEDPTKIDTYQMLVHTFGATGSPCCASLAVKCVARDNKEIYSRAASESIL